MDAIAADPNTTLTDLELRDRMLGRDPDAWLEFHRRFDRLVLRCVQRVVQRFRGRFSEDDVHEIRAQFHLDLTARDLHRLRAFEPGRGAKLGTWIGMLATNTAWDFVRSAGRNPTLPFDVRTHDVVADVADLADVVSHRDAVRRVRDAVSRFSERDRAFVQLYFVDGLEAEQVAEAMAISVKTVYSKKHKIRARLTELGLAVA